MLALFLLSSPYHALAINSTTLKKYPYQLLTNDYRILNQKDLAEYAHEETPRPFSPGKTDGNTYWQCFPRDKVSIFLEDMGYSTEDYGWEDTLADLTIKIYTKPGVIHEYQMRRPWPVTDYEKRFRLWHRLMNGEKYVCFAGSFGNIESREVNGNLKEIHEWIFEKIKTKKGSDSYF
jgi:hypothetical protein